MALSRGVFHPRFTTHHRPVVKSSFLGTVLIERMGVKGVWDVDLGQYAGAVMIPLFRGAARVQKVARPTRRENVQDSADNQVIRVQILEEDNELVFPDNFEWQANDRVTVLTNDSDVRMEQMTVYIHAWPTSTNSWGRTFTCRYNTRQGTL